MMYDDDYSWFDDEDEDLFHKMLELKSKIQKKIDENMDEAPMEVGDRVIPWDGSSLTDMKGEKCYIVYEPFASTPYWIIISNEENTEHDSGVKVYKQDLIIAHPETKEKYRINKRGVKHV